MGAQRLARCAEGGRRGGGVWEGARCVSKAKSSEWPAGQPRARPGGLTHKSSCRAAPCALSRSGRGRVGFRGVCQCVSRARFAERKGGAAAANAAAPPRTELLLAGGQLNIRNLIECGPQAHLQGLGEEEALGAVGVGGQGRKARASLATRPPAEARWQGVLLLRARGVGGQGANSTRWRVCCLFRRLIAGGACARAHSGCAALSRSGMALQHHTAGCI